MKSMPFKPGLPGGSLIVLMDSAFVSPRDGTVPFGLVQSEKAQSASIPRLAMTRPMHAKLPFLSQATICKARTLGTPL